MTVIHPYLALLAPSMLMLFSIAFCYAEPIAPPPAPPPISAEIKSSNTATVIERQSEAQATRQDKPDEEQEQFPVPDLVIRYKDGAKIEEYRVNGQLRYAKITPKIGPAYYLIDTDGDGRFDRRHDHLDNPPIQQWLLYSW